MMVMMMSGEKEKRKRKRPEESIRLGDGEAADQDLHFQGVSAYFVETGVQPKRLQIWKQKLQQLGAVLEEHWSKHLTHIFASNVETLTEKLGSHKLEKRKMHFLKYSWIEDCLKAGKCLPITEPYVLKISSEGETLSQTSVEDSEVRGSQTQQELGSQKPSDWMHIIKEGGKMGVVPSRAKAARKKEGGLLDSQGEFSEKESSMEDEGNELPTAEISSAKDGHLEPEAGYAPPNLNAHITGPFSEIRDIYKEALGDDRRYFSYYKALSVLEKVPFKITSVDQIKGLPAIGKSLRDSIQEILSSGKLSKLEHLKNDEKVRVIGLFGSVWGIGPVTAQKLYDKGHRSLEDLKGDPSLTPPQRYGLKFHYDIIKKIPRHEIKVMEALVQKAGAELRSGISVICGGSYRRGKAESSDMDFVITHPDGHSHTGFLIELIRKLKEEDFLTEDLKIAIDHSSEGTDHGVDTYFGLCKFPGREQRHRIDLKAYPFDQYPFGLIAWTGNDILNRRLRILADSKGYKLDDHGLYPVITDAHGGKVKSPVSVPCKSEHEVFEKLGFPWLEPHERNL